MKKVIICLVVIAIIAALVWLLAFRKNEPVEVAPSGEVVTSGEEVVSGEEFVDIPKNEQEGTAGSNMPLKDNLEEAKHQIEVAFQTWIEKAYSGDVVDSKIYVEKMYTTEEEQANEALKEKNLGPNEIAFEVKYELKPAEGADINALTAGTGEYDEESGWVKEKYNVGILRPTISEEALYRVTDVGTGW